MDFVEGVGDDNKVFLQLWPLITGNQSERISLVRGELEAGASRVVKRSQLRRLPFRLRHSSSASPRDGSVSNVSPSHVPQQPLQGDAATPRAKPALETLATQTAEQKFANRKISFASGGEKVEEVSGWRAERAHER